VIHPAAFPASHLRLALDIQRGADTAVLRLHAINEAIDGREPSHEERVDLLLGMIEFISRRDFATGMTTTINQSIRK
jgi:hypothetical protein